MPPSSGGARVPPFITFEGIEGSGKTTQIQLLSNSLEERGVDHLLTREPGGTPIGDQIRRIVLHPASVMGPWCELLLYAAARAQHLDQVIRPALAEGRLVLCDRFTDATRAYQGYGRGLALDVIERLHATGPLALEPVRTILIDLDPAVALERAGDRDRKRSNEENRFENEALAFHARVRAGYLEIAGRSPGRFRVVDGRGGVAEVQARVNAALAGLVPSP
jgi:dTMP kinase